MTSRGCSLVITNKIKTGYVEYKFNDGVCEVDMEVSFHTQVPKETIISSILGI